MSISRNRGLSDETIRRFGLGYSHEDTAMTCTGICRRKGYGDGILKETGLFYIGRTGIQGQVLEPGHVPDPGCQ